MAIDKNWRERSKKHGMSANAFLIVLAGLAFAVGAYFLSADVFIESRLSRALFTPLQVEVTGEKKLGRSFYEVYFRYRGKEYRLAHRMESGTGLQWVDREKKLARVYADARYPTRAMSPTGSYFSALWYGGLLLMLSFFAGRYICGKTWPYPGGLNERDPKEDVPPEPLPEGRTAAGLMGRNIAFGIVPAVLFAGLFLAVALGAGLVLGLAAVFSAVSLLGGIFAALNVRSRMKGRKKI